MIGALADRILAMLVRGVIKRVTDSAKAQALQVALLEGEVADPVERFQGYGFTSVPLPGAEVLVINLGGNPDHPIAVQTEDRRYRPTAWESGEVGLYDDQGQWVRLGRGGILVLTREGGRTVRLGVTSGGTFDPIMAYTDASADLTQIETQFNALVTQVNAALALMEAKFSTAKLAVIPPDAAVGASGYAPATAVLDLTTGTQAANAEVEV